jgi:tetratricopeptide (TPR) repeat protein
MKKTFLFIFILIFSVNIFAQRNIPAGFDLLNYGVKVEPDKRLMTVLATLELARTKGENGDEASIKTPLSAQGILFRDQLNADLQSVPADLRQKVSLFIENYKKRHPKASNAEIVAPFISMAYTLTPVPELADPVITNDLPGELLDVLDFAPLVREFYRRSVFAGKINEYVKNYQTNSDDKLRGSAKEMVKELLDYLHTRPQVYYTERIKTETSKIGSKKGKIQNISERQRERRFFIVPEMLAPNGNISFLNIGDDYYAIVPPDTDLTQSEVRRGFLQFVFDPLVLTNAKEVATVRPNIKLLLDERRKTNPNVSPDVYRAVSRSLVAATDARQNEFEKVRIATAQARQNIVRMKTEAEKKAVSAELAKFTQAAADETAVQLSEAYENGAVLSFYFAEQLKGLEDSGFDIASSMREMILSLDATKETNRLEQFAEARKRGEENRKKTIGTTVAIENPVTNRLLEIQKIIEAKNYSAAQAQLKQLLEKNPGEPRIFYGIGRVASLSAESIEDVEQRKTKLLEAKVAYENVLRSATPTTDRALISLTYVGLARIYEFYDETAYAIKIYDAAIKIGDVNGGAFREAMAGKERLLKNQ